MTEGSECKKTFFFMLKSVLKCMEFIRIKIWVKKIQYLSANSVGGGGGPAELVKSQLFDFF